MFESSTIDPFSFLYVMFSSLGLFKTIECPERSNCALSNCIFSHHRSTSRHTTASHPLVSHHAKPEDSDTLDIPRKRRKVSGPSDEADDTVATTSHPSQSEPASLPTPERSRSPKIERFTAAPRSISPPPLRNSKKGSSHGSEKAQEKPTKTIARAKTKPTPIETLNPRMIANPPASHQTRLRLITMIHEQMVRLNELVKNGDDPPKAALKLSAQELVTTVLDEEEKAAKRNPSVYANVLKLRIVALKKMEISAWKQERFKAIQNELGGPSPPKPSPPKALDTGLSSEKEIAFLPRLIAKQEGLAKHGYVTSPSQVSEAQVKQAREGIEASSNWEKCDRCGSRFQVFPGRSEDGSLTTGGSCCHHPSKARRRPARDKADKSEKDSIYQCCNEVVGKSVGCTTSPTHVFKVSDPKRLALILPFEETPENEALKSKRTAACFDCEMGYTTYGMELIRLTATSWPSGALLLDTLVRPLGEVLDLNTRFSGVSPSDFSPKRSLNTATSDNDGRKTLPIASSPVAARSLLFKLISPSTPLIGHALENDLNAW